MGDSIICFHISFCTISLLAHQPRLFLQKKRKERGQQKNESALDRLEKDLKQEAERLDLPLEQKTKAMKQRERKVCFIM